MAMDVLHTRRSFYVGGSLDNDLTQASSQNGSIHTGQMYVEELKPGKVTEEFPIVFWPGTGSTGACWVTTPDGRPGWASYFLGQGYTVYLVDPPERGRSQAVPDSGRFAVIGSEYARKFWTSTKENNKMWPSAELHTQWPDTGKTGAESFDQFLASQVQSRADYAIAEVNAQIAGAKLLEEIGPAILCTHSSGGSQGWLIADRVPYLVKAIVALEPLGPPFVNRLASVVAKADPTKRVRPYGITTVPITYDPPLKSSGDLQLRILPSKDSTLCDTILQLEPVRSLPNLSRFPVLIVTGESGYHSYYDHATVEYLQEAGVKVEHMKLVDLGVNGNGHFMFLERNSNDIAVAIQTWLKSKIQALTTQRHCTRT